MGTEAGFAVSVMNRKLDLGLGLPLAIHIEAIKEGQEPITFGPNSVLLNYGDGWTLQTVTDLDFSGNLLLLLLFFPILGLLNNFHFWVFFFFGYLGFVINFHLWVVFGSCNFKFGF